MIATDESLMWAGITPPPPGSRKTTCPVCSHTRSKPRERCLAIFDRDWGFEWTCRHCGWEGGEAT